MSVVPLVRIDGFKSMYQRNQAVTLVPRKKLLRFSHQVREKRILGKEAPNSPQNCCDLDPAANIEDEFMAT